MHGIAANLSNVIEHSSLGLMIEDYNDSSLAQASLKFERPLVDCTLLIAHTHHIFSTIVYEGTIRGFEESKVLHYRVASAQLYAIHHIMPWYHEKDPYFPQLALRT
jgi:hypothetical protein